MQNKTLHDNYITCNIKKKIVNNPRMTHIEIRHIPSHSGIPENDLVDLAAKNASTQGIFNVVSWSIKDDTAEIHRIIQKHWEEEHAEFANKQRHIKNPWFKNPNCKRKSTDTKIINRLLSDNAFDNYTLNKMYVTTFCT